MKLEKQSPKRGFRVFRWSLRTLFVAVSCVSVCFALIAPARTPRPIERRIVAMKGTVESSIESNQWTTPVSILNELVGPFQRFSSIYLVKVESDEFCDGDMSELCEMQDLKAVNIRSKRLTDVGVSHLRRIPIRYLILNCPLVTDDGLRALEGKRRLYQVDIVSDHVSGKFLSDLDPGAPLFELKLTGAMVDDRACQGAAKFQDLNELVLANSQVTDAGLEFLIGRHSLRVLDVRNTRVTADGVARFAKRMYYVKVLSDY